MPFEDALCIEKIYENKKGSWSVLELTGDVKSMCFVINYVRL